MKTYVAKEVKLLSLIFLLLFLGYNGVQQYITAFFSQIGLPQAGFQSLIVIYASFTLSDPFSAIFVSKYGSKASMTLASIFYGLFILSLATKSLILIYIASALIGIAGSLLWTGQNSYLIRASKQGSYGANAGFFATLFSVGSSLGVIILGFIIPRISYQLSFFIAALLPFVSFILFLKIKDVRIESTGNHLQLLKNIITNKTALRLSLVWFSYQFIYGFVIGQIPVEIKNTLGVSFIGLSSLFYIVPILFSYVLGKLSDVKGRKSLLIASFIVSILGLGSLYIAHNPIFLISGIILLAANLSIVGPLTAALIGDITTKKNLEYITALFWTVQNLGVVSALVISIFIQTKIVYLISIGVLVIIFAILFPLLILPLSTIKQKLAQDAG